MKASRSRLYALANKEDDRAVGMEAVDRHDIGFR